MPADNTTYLVELIGQLANARTFELPGGESFETQELSVRGSVRTVVHMSKFDVEKLLNSPDHKDHIRVYIQQGENEPRLVYPRRRL